MKWGLSAVAVNGTTYCRDSTIAARHTSQAGRRAAVWPVCHRSQGVWQAKVWHFQAVRCPNPEVFAAYGGSVTGHRDPRHYVGPYGSVSHPGPPPLRSNLYSTRMRFMRYVLYVFDLVSRRLTSAQAIAVGAYQISSYCRPKALCLPRQSLPTLIE